MANHVSGYLSVRTISEEGQKVWDEYVLGTLNEHKVEGSWEVHLGHFIFKTDEPGGEFTDWDFNTMCESVGAKWAYATDWDECGMAMYSAWSPCTEFADTLAKKIGEVDPSVELVLTYEDEMPNFVGVTTYNKNGMDTDEVLEHDEMMDMMKEREPRLVELWDEENEEWTDEDEAWELINEIQWDMISDWQSENEFWSIV